MECFRFKHRCNIICGGSLDAIVNAMAELPKPNITWDQACGDRSAVLQAFMERRKRADVGSHVEPEHHVKWVFFAVGGFRSQLHLDS